MRGIILLVALSSLYCAGAEHILKSVIYDGSYRLVNGNGHDNYVVTVNYTDRTFKDG